MTKEDAAIEILKELIRCPSITPSDSGAQDVLIKRLEKAGFEIFDLPFGEGQERIKNFFARIGTGSPHLCFAGHTDVVPPGPEVKWTHPPFAAAEENGLIYGRGTSDMKGGVAAFTAAVLEYLDNLDGELQGSLSFLITGDEEGPAINGTDKVLGWMEQNGHVPDMCLVAEPTNPNYLGQEIKIGRRGSLTGTLSVKGKQGHVAYQHLADNPLPRLVKLLDLLSNLKLDEGSDNFAASNFEITTIDVGNTASNVIPREGKAVFNVRFNDHWSSKTLETFIREKLDESGLDYNLETESNAESFVTKQGFFTDEIVRAIEHITGKKPALTTGGGTSDARFIARACPVAEFGLINATIHQIDEHTARSDMLTLKEIYITLIGNILRKPNQPD